MVLPQILLSASFEKLSGTRAWLQKVKTSRWKQKRVWFSANSQIHYSPDLHLPEAHLPLPGLLVPPGAVRRGTYAEQIKHSRPCLFVVTAVLATAYADRDARKHVLFFSASTAEQLENWMQVITRVSFERMKVSQSVPYANAILAVWGHAQTLKPKEVLEVSRDLNWKTNDNRLRLLYEKIHGAPVSKDLSFDQFLPVIVRVAVEELLFPIFKMLQIDLNAPISPQRLAEMLDKSEEEVNDLLRQQKVEACTHELLLYFLHHPDNSIVDPQRAEKLHDMSLPLNRYLISSSHNTYLTGDQLKSNSSAAMYRLVLERGCRCVEIDVWDGDDGIPIVTHGHTMTSKEPLENVLKVIRDHSFSHGNPYPVIVSIENHLGRPQQLVAADLIKKIFGESLHAPGAEHRVDEVLPSPESLKNKIVIKAKTGMSVLRPEYKEEYSGNPLESTGDFEEDDSDDPTSSPDQPTDASSSKQESPSPSSEPEKVNKIAPEFAELVALAGGNRKKLMALWKTGISGNDRYMAASCVSINEKKVTDLYVSKALDAIREYNSHGLTRVYPKGSRVDSSNYFPIQAQFLHCQIVAMNWQSGDTAIGINHARFLANGGRGYVLASTMPPEERPGTLSLQILSAFLLPKPEKGVRNDTNDSYCTLKLYDTVFDDDDSCCSFEHETKVAKSNGFSPAWHESMTIPIRDRELAVLNLKVYDKDRTSGDEMVGYNSFPVSLLRPGLRSIPINYKHGNPVEAPGTSLRPSVLCNVVWT